MTEIYNSQENELVCKALKAAGVEVKSVYDLVNSKNSYPEAISVLLEMLNRVKSDRMIEGIARALTVREATGIALNPLVELFRNYTPLTPSQEATKWAIGNAISEIADDSSFEEILELARDARHGRARQMLPRSLSRMRNPHVVDLLISFLDEDDLRGQAIWSLGKLRAEKARAAIEGFKNDTNPSIRKEAAKALRRIGPAR